MNSSTAVQNFASPKVVLVGNVFQALCDKNAVGFVLMRFNRCAYIQFDTQLICIGLRQLGASSITGLFDNSITVLPQAIERGAVVRLSSDGLIVDDDYFIDMADSSVYESSPQYGLCDRFNIPIQHELIDSLDLPADGLAPLLRNNAKAADTALTQFARPSVENMLNLVQISCSDNAVFNSGQKIDSAAFRSLVGAGPGLTPSGDDFICGVFAALYLVGKPCVATSLWDGLYRFAEASTTAVSFAIMQQAAQGDSSERQEALVKAYLAYPTMPSGKVQKMLGQIGQTSGWDWLAGFVLCLNKLKHRTAFNNS